MSPNESPNVLLMMTDAQRRDTLGCYGNRLVRTPAIDGLAAEGVRFAEWHVPNPLCMGARASLMTGHYPSSHGVRTNGMNLGDALPAIAELLVGAGYRTASVGKLHLNLWWADEPGHSQEGRADWAAGRRRIDLPYFGFQAVDVAIGHNEDSWGPYAAWLAEVCPDGHALMQPENALRAPSGALCTWDSALPAEVHCTNWVADRAIARLRARDPHRPFFVVASFPDPHMSYSPPAPYCRMYDPADVPPPLWREGELDRLPPHFRAYYEGTGYCRAMFEDAALNMRPAAVHTKHQWRDMLAHHWGQVTLIDDAVGRILAALDEQGLRESTVVIFTTDHGALMGDHGMHMHGPFHYDGQLRIPAIWRWPGRFPRRPGQPSARQHRGRGADTARAGRRRGARGDAGRQPGRGAGRRRVRLASPGGRHRIRRRAVRALFPHGDDASLEADALRGPALWRALRPGRRPRGVP